MFAAPLLRVSRSNTVGGIGGDYLDVVANPLYEALVHCRWDATIRVYPITTEQHIVGPFAINNKESSGKGLTADGEVDAECSAGGGHVALKILEHHVRLG